MRRDSGRWTASDQAHFEEWLRASMLNRVAFLRLELGWEDARRLQALGAGIQGDDPPPPGQWNLTPFFDVQLSTVEARSRRKTPPWRKFALAATVLLAVASAWVLWPAGKLYVTPVGGISSVPMADGSKITLNTDSRVRISVTEEARRVDLKQGEAFFEVAQDSNRPFIIDVGAHRVVVLGTQFAVRRRADAIQVTVADGRVRVDGVEGEALVLEAGAVAQVTTEGVSLESMPLPELEERLAWRAGVLMFRDRTLAEVVVEFNRYNVRQFVIGDATLGALKIEGNFRATNFDGFARLLEEAYPVDVEPGPRGRWLIRPSNPQ
jgi:transmembrane sensor